jgi:hypothetical protein
MWSFTISLPRPTVSILNLIAMKESLRQGRAVGIDEVVCSVIEDRFPIPPLESVRRAPAEALAGV